MSRKKTLDERKLDGNPGKRPLTTPPRAQPGEPEAPEYIQHSPLAMAEWGRIISILGQENRLTQFDGGQIAAACMSFEVMVKGYEAYGGNVTTESRDRGPVKNPALQIFRDGKDAYERACNSLGVNTGSREVTKGDTNEDPHGQLS